MLWDSIKLLEKNSQGAASRRTPFDAADCDAVLCPRCAAAFSLFRSLARSTKASNEVAATKKKKLNQADHVTLNLITFQTLTLFFYSSLSLDAQQPFSCVYQGAGISTRCRGVKNIRCLSPTIYYEIYSAHKRQASREILARQPHTLTRRRDAGEKNRAEIYGCEFFCFSINIFNLLDAKCV